MKNITPILAAAIALSVSSVLAGDVKEIYEKSCMKRHGADGKGETPAGKKMGTHDLASPEVQKMSDADLTQTIEKGKNKMPAYKGKLTDKQIDELVKYIKELN